MLGPDYVELANAAVREGIAAREAADPDATFFHDEAGFTSIDEDQPSISTRRATRWCSLRNMSWPPATWASWSSRCPSPDRRSRQNMNINSESGQECLPGFGNFFFDNRGRRSAILSYINIRLYTNIITCVERRK